MNNIYNEKYRDISIEEYEIETIEKNNIIELYKKIIEEANSFNKVIISNHEKFKKVIEDSKIDKIKLKVNSIKNKSQFNIKYIKKINEISLNYNGIKNIEAINVKIKEENEKLKIENEMLKEEKNHIESQKNNISKELKDKILEYNEKFKAKLRQLEEENSSLSINIKEDSKINLEEKLTIFDSETKAEKEIQENFKDLIRENEILKEENNKIENQKNNISKELKNKILKYKEQFKAKLWQLKEENSSFSTIIKDLIKENEKLQEENNKINKIENQRNIISEVLKDNILEYKEKFKAKLRQIEEENSSFSINIKEDSKNNEEEILNLFQSEKKTRAEKEIQKKFKDLIKENEKLKVEINDIRIKMTKKKINIFSDSDESEDNYNLNNCQLEEEKSISENEEEIENLQKKESLKNESQSDYFK